MSREGLPSATRFLVIAELAPRSLRSRLYEWPGRLPVIVPAPLWTAFLQSGRRSSPALLSRSSVCSERDRGLPLFWTLLVPVAWRRDRMQHRARAARRGTAMRHTRTGWWLEEAGQSRLPPLVGDARPTSSSSAAGISASGRRGSCASSSPSSTSLVARGCALRARPERAERRLLRDAVGRRRRHSASEPATPRRSPSAARRRTPCAGSAPGAARTRSTRGSAQAPMLRVATTESQVGSWDDVVARRRPLGAPDEVVSHPAEEVRARCASPLFLGGALSA